MALSLSRGIVVIRPLPPRNIDQTWGLGYIHLGMSDSFRRSARATDWAKGLLCIGVAFSFAAGPILGIAHLSAVDHVVCPLDGELIEVAGHHGGTPAASGTNTLASYFRSTDEAVPIAGHGHSHCLFATHALPQATATAPEPPSALLPLNDANRGGALMLSQEGFQPVDVYRVAPKSSPPAA
jgi:hypothetical protein